MNKRLGSKAGDQPDAGAEPRNADDGRGKAIDVLRSALMEGEQSGPPAPFDFDAFIAGLRAD